MNGSASTYQGRPGNLTIVMCPDASNHVPGPVNIGSSAALYANLYAPQSTIKTTGARGTSMDASWGSRSTWRGARRFTMT